MRLTWCFGCLFVALDCVEKATGQQGDVIFAHNAMWMWWLFAGVWAVAAVRALTY